jgi:hypothetical protein
MRKSTKLTLATIGLGVSVAAGIAGPAFAATAAPPTASAATATPSATPGAGSNQHGGMGRRFGAEFAKDLAAQLGLPQQKVTVAVQQVRTEMRADQKNGTATRGEFVTQLAGKLGLDQTKVRAAVQAVFAQERADRQAQLKLRLDAAVKAGKISQSDADAYLRVVQSGALHSATK